MKSTLVKQLLSAMLLLLPFGVINAQQANARVTELLNNSDWFVLNDEWPSLKSQVQNDCLSAMAETMLVHIFDPVDSAGDKMKWFIANYQEDFDLATLLGCMKWHLSDLELAGKYSEAAEMAKLYGNAIREQQLPENPYYYDVVYDRNKALDGYPAPSVSIPEGKDVRVGFHAAGQGDNIMLSVKCNGKDCDMMLDTRSGLSYMSQALADALGVKAIDGTTNLDGTRIAKVNEIVVDDAIKFKNVVVKVFDYTDNEGNPVLCGGIGMDFIRRVPEVQIDTKEKCLVFPARLSPIPPYGKNLKRDNEGIRMRVNDAYGSMEVRLVTSDPWITFGYSYYEKRVAEFASLKDRQVVMGDKGFGMVRAGAVVVPDMNFMTCGEKVRFDKILVPPSEMENFLTTDDATFGMGFINKFDKVTINMRDMFMKVE